MTGFLDQNLVLSTEFPHCSSSHLELASGAVALCLCWLSKIQRWAQNPPLLTSLHSIWEL